MLLLHLTMKSIRAFQKKSEAGSVMRVLIVDDHPPMRQLIRSVVSDRPESVTECADGASADGRRRSKPSSHSRLQTFFGMLELTSLSVKECNIRQAVVIGGTTLLR